MPMTDSSWGTARDIADAAVPGLTARQRRRVRRGWQAVIGACWALVMYSVIVSDGPVLPRAALAVAALVVAPLAVILFAATHIAVRNWLALYRPQPGTGTGGGSPVQVVAGEHSGTDDGPGR